MEGRVCRFWKVPRTKLIVSLFFFFLLETIQEESRGDSFLLNLSEGNQSNPS